MAENSGIGWTHHTKNFWWGCDKVSAECTHCYIGPTMKRAGVKPFGGPIRCKGFYKDSARRDALAACRSSHVFADAADDRYHQRSLPW